MKQHSFTRSLARLRPTLLAIVLLLAALGCAAPLVVGAAISLTPAAHLSPGGAIFAAENIVGAPSWEHYATLFSQHGFTASFWITVAATVVISAGQCAASTLAAYAFARLRFPGKEPLFWLYMATMAVPAITLVVPLYLGASSLGLRGTFAGLVVPFVLGSPFAVFWLRQSFRRMPQELLDAAQLDGATHWRTLVSVVLPANWSVLAVLGFITVATQWNSFLWPSVIASSANGARVLTVATAALQSQYQSNWPLVLAATTLTLLPMVVAFGVGALVFAHSPSFHRH